MIALYSLSLALGTIVFVCLTNFGLGKRFLIAFLVFAIASIVLTVTLVVVGDKPTPGSRIITPEELDREGN